MKRARFYSTVAAIVVTGMLAAAYTARADDAARSWSQTMGYQSPSQQALDFNKAQAEYLLRNGITPGAAVTNCQVAGACQNGGTSTNISGYSEVNVTDSDGTNIIVDVDSDADQDAVSVVADDIGNLPIN